jgi:hypothetical protein
VLIASPVVGQATNLLFLSEPQIMKKFVFLEILHLGKEVNFLV